MDKREVLGWGNRKGRGGIGGGGIEEFHMGVPHLVATTFYGGIYIFTVFPEDNGKGRRGLGMKAVNLVRPIVENEYEMGVDTVPLPTAI